jgi:hypothetical protein
MYKGHITYSRDLTYADNAFIIEVQSLLTVYVKNCEAVPWTMVLLILSSMMDNYGAISASFI